MRPRHVGQRLMLRWLQARTALAYEGVVDGARHELAARADAAAAADKAARGREEAIIAEREALRVEVDRKEAHLKSLSQVHTHATVPLPVPL